MKRRDNKIYIEDILESMEKIDRYISGLSQETIKQNELVVDAVVRNLEIIGEAAGHIPDYMTKKYPQIPWRKMASLRNIAIHEYFGVDLDIIWEIVSRNLPETKEGLKKILKALSSG